MQHITIGLPKGPRTKSAQDKRRAERANHHDSTYCTVAVKADAKQVKSTTLLCKWSAIAIDATFGTNNMKFPLFTLMVFDDHENGIPVAMCVASRENSQTVEMILRAFRDTLRESQPDWEPRCFLVDCADSEAAAIRAVWGDAVEIILLSEPYVGK
ncbi:hypothetical protein WJX72_004022 [[Myrmecia] bisecta]|uniref:ZSWIM1/3 RNaseH-like domain-containing protein n=1 Tax=[Myrmecia] bisecta TaxID=41462 RepID=A0AAW1Q9Y3_9CHLO